jgi:predicted phage terminase large subunit-like protein
MVLHRIIDFFTRNFLGYEKVRSLEYVAEKGTYYNFSVSPDHTFYAEGYLTHNCGLIDDPISEQDMYSRLVMDRVAEWYSAGFYTRRQPERNKIILVMTRWNVADLAGQLLDAENADESADKWRIVKIPALITQEIADKLNAIASDPKYEKFLNTGKHPYPMVYKAGDSFSPRRWSKKELLRTKANLSKKVWSALYMQEPTEEGGGIMPADKWRKWDNEYLPQCDHIFQSYDTAFEESEKNDYTVRTTWGIFQRPEDNKFACILLERLRKRITFPDLRQNAVDSAAEYEPDKILIEKKASGHSLIQELRKTLPVLPVEAKGSKLTRAHVASFMLEKGFIYYVPRKWAYEVIDECAAYPNGPFDDCVDSCGQAWLYFRRKFYLQLDEEDDNEQDSQEAPTGRYPRHFNPQGSN